MNEFELMRKIVEQFWILLDQLTVRQNSIEKIQEKILIIIPFFESHILFG